MKFMLTFAIKPGGTGDITESHVLWSQKRYLPVIPSPLFYQGNPPDFFSDDHSFDTILF